MKPSFTMALRGVAAELLVLTVRGKEELGQLYRFEVRVAAGEELAWEAVLGVPADLHLAVKPIERTEINDLQVILTGKPRSTRH